MQHLVAAGQLTPEVLTELMNKAEEFRKLLETKDGRNQLRALYPDKVVATLFYEPSTRTRLSHESAAQRLGMGVVSTENAAEFSSAIKGETIEDTVRVVCGYADAIVIRHKETGIVDRAAAASPVPIINAGDGTGEHPTQALLDAYTMRRHLRDGTGALEGVRVGNLMPTFTATAAAGSITIAAADVTLRNQQGLSARDFARTAERQDVADLINRALRAKLGPPTW